MPYRISRHAEHLVWVTFEGHLTTQHADSYFFELWSLLDSCPPPTDLLVDGRRISGGAPAARRRGDQILHHPHLGHLAFVVGELHLLFFAPLVKLVSGIGLFGDEGEALAYLRTARGQTIRHDLAPQHLPPHPFEAGHEVLGATAPQQRAVGARHAQTRPLPPLPASRLKRTPIDQRNPISPAEAFRAGAGDGEPED